ncbi:unnamed protein product [Caenorhabditis angaria]|uniref:Beta-lactamase-related domain-containing protein n=1 Tax=Caenorhabditis angaria TaxID=860376 RepID=A0A9P1IEM9_9PELO|nr:unnamed protein product [Caenorhabditis angaria]
MAGIWERIKKVIFTVFLAAAFQSISWRPRQNLQDNWERSGAAFVVYSKGKKVVDLWGGYSDKESGRLWKNDTLSVAFSCSKAIGSLVIAKLMDSGKLNYNDLVSKYWPEFSKNGKENVTISWLLTHKAGLAYTDHPISIEDAKNPSKIDEIFENQVPNWPPGTEIGYHAITHGWLVDALVRKIDGRTVGQYFKQEIAEKFDLDFHVSLPISEQFRVARLQNPSIFNVLEEIAYSPWDFNLKRFAWDKLKNGTWSKVAQTTPWIRFVEAMSLNDPDLHRLEQSAVLGIGTARDLAKIFELHQNRQNHLGIDYESWPDVVTGAVAPRAFGFMMKEYEYREGKTVKLFGHSGYGGQNIRFDFENQIVIAYLSNGLKVGFGDTARTWKRLLKSVYDTIP